MSEDLFADPAVRADLTRLLIESGAVRELVQSDPGEAEQLLVKILRDERFRRFSNHRKILMDWIQPFRQHTERGLPEEDDPESQQPAQIKEVVRRRGLEVFDAVNRAKESIKREFSQGNDQRAWRYIDDLIRFQTKQSEPERLAKTLCDLAMHAKSIGASQIQFELSQRAVGILPTDAWSLCQLGDAYLQLNQLDRAYETYATAMANASSKDETEAVARTGKAEVLKALGRLDEALAEYEATAAAFPHSEFARTGKAEVLKALGRLDEALAEYEATAAAFPHNVVARTGKAEVLKGLGRLDEALAEYEATVTAFPHNEVARNGKACVLVMVGQDNKALEIVSLEKPRTKEDWINQHVRGMIHLRQGGFDQAVSAFERGLSVDNPWVETHEYFRRSLALARIRQKEFAAAATTLSADNSAVADTLRLHIFGELKQTEGARQALERIEKSKLAVVVELRPELAARYVYKRPPQHSDEWVFERECNLLLAA